MQVEGTIHKIRNDKHHCLFYLVVGDADDKDNFKLMSYTKRELKELNLNTEKLRDSQLVVLPTTTQSPQLVIFEPDKCLSIYEQCSENMEFSLTKRINIE